MMTRRPHRTKGILHMSDKHGVHGFNNPARGMQGHVTGFFANAHIAARQFGFAGLDKLENIFNILGIVAQSNLVEACLPGAHYDEVLEGIQRLSDRGQSFRALGMPVLRPVIHQEIVKEKSRARHSSIVPQLSPSRRRSNGNQFGARNTRFGQNATAQYFDHQARRRSYEIVRQVAGSSARATVEGIATGARK